MHGAHTPPPKQPPLWAIPRKLTATKNFIPVRSTSIFHISKIKGLSHLQVQLLQAYGTKKHTNSPQFGLVRRINFDAPVADPEVEVRAVARVHSAVALLHEPLLCAESTAGNTRQKTPTTSVNEDLSQRG